MTLDSSKQSASLDRAMQQAVARVLDVVDPPLWLVTAADGERHGGLIATFAVRASIVEALPRMVLGIAKQHHTWELIEASGRFALHLLEPTQVGLVRRFGLHSGHDIDKLAGLPALTTPGGAPLLADTLAWLDCRVEARMDTGDRTVYLAAVEAGGTNGDGPPMTAGRLFSDAPRELREQLDALYERDGGIDATAILRWRKDRTGG